MTYGETAEMLARKLETTKLVSLHIGGVAGEMMNMITSVVEGAPPINALVTNTSRIPGDGFAWYCDNLWRAQREHRWEFLSKDQKLDIVRGVREAAKKYEGWELVFQEAFGDRPGKLNQKKSPSRMANLPKRHF